MWSIMAQRESPTKCQHSAVLLPVRESPYPLRGRSEQVELAFQAELASEYKSATQRIRILSEHWVSTQVYCPNCGCVNIARYKNNSPVADFFCSHCREDYELKGYKKAFGARIVDGAYRTMMERLKASNNPNLLLLGYDHRKLEVRNLLVIPKQFFIPEIIEERRPLSVSARRAGWIGCNIRLDGIPNVGRIFLIRNGITEPSMDVIARWRMTLFLRDRQDLRSKGWLLSVMRCIDKLHRDIFSLEDVYAFEAELGAAYPENRHIKPKIRQQLQVLRDMNYLIFLGNGAYQLAAPARQSSPPVRAR
jgi:type II restriction enzyme